MFINRGSLVFGFLSAALNNWIDSPCSIERSTITFFFLLCVSICCVNYANFAYSDTYTFRIQTKFKRVRWDSDPRHYNPIYTDWLRARRSTWLSYEPIRWNFKMCRYLNLIYQHSTCLLDYSWNSINHIQKGTFVPYLILGKKNEIAWISD